MLKKSINIKKEDDRKKEVTDMNTHTPHTPSDRADCGHVPTTQNGIKHSNYEA